MAKQTRQEKVKKKVTKKAKREAKKYAKSHPKQVLIALLVIVLIVAIVLGSIYLLDRDLFNKIFHIGGDVTDNGGSGAGGDTGGSTPPPSEIIGDRLEVHFLDIGQGDSIFVRLPDGKNMMIDAGGAYDDNAHPDYDEALGKKRSVSKKILSYLDNLGVKTIDAFILTHSDADHCDFMDDVIEHYDVLNIFVPALTYDEVPKGAPEIPGNVGTKVFRDAMTAAKNEKYIDKQGVEKSANVVENVGDIVNLTGDGYTVKSYCRDKEYYKGVKYGNAKKLNAVSPITVLEYGGRKVVFTGDGEGDGKQNDTEQWFMAKNIAMDIDVLKVGHHGSADSTSTAFLEYMDPEYAVISCGNKNGHEHPRKANLDRLDAYRDIAPDGDADGIAALYRTDKNGNIVLTIGANGGMQFKTDREVTREEMYTPAPPKKTTTASNIGYAMVA